MRLSRESMVPSMRLATLLLVLFLHQTYSESARKPNECEESKNRGYWEKAGKDDVRDAWRKRDNNNVAKNVVIFLGDGMGITVSTAARIYKGQQNGTCGEEGYLSWERLNNMALVKTYNTDKQVADSAATATAYLGGVKTNWFTLGVDARVKLNDCKASKEKDNQVDSILHWAQEEGMRTGFVTTTRVTHATPAATYAHTGNREWEADTDLPDDNEVNGNCKDIAHQLVTEETGRRLNVIMGGGREMFGACTKNDSKEYDLNDNMEKDECEDRKDGRNLVNEWLAEKKENGSNAEYVTNSSDLQTVSSDVDYLMGLFNKSHLPYKIDMDEVGGLPNYDAPRLEDMMLKALSILDKGDKGFVLLVEGGRIDHGLHEDWTRKALEETLEFDKAIEMAKKKLNFEETLMVVTADHSHPITINGYPERGNDILGLAGTDPESALGSDGLPYTTIMYTNGPGYMDKYGVDNRTDDSKKNIMDPVGSLMMGDDNEDFDEDDDDDSDEDDDDHGDSHMVMRVNQNQSDIDTTDRTYRHLAAVPRKLFQGTHGGEDVAVYAEGPMSHLFHRLHEQSYVAYVMATAACIGPGKEICKEMDRVRPRTPKTVDNEVDSKKNIMDPVGSLMMGNDNEEFDEDDNEEFDEDELDDDEHGESPISIIDLIGQPVNPFNLLGRFVSVGSLGAAFSTGAFGAGSAASASSSGSAAASTSAGA